MGSPVACCAKHVGFVQSIGILWHVAALPFAIKDRLGRVCLIFAAFNLFVIVPCIRTVFAPGYPALGYGKDLKSCFQTLATLQSRAKI